MSEIKDYTTDIENLFIQFLMSDPALFVTCRPILTSEHFNDSKNRKAISFIVDHASKYVSLPTVEQIKAVTGKEVELINDITESHHKWFLHEFEDFARHKSLEAVILESVGLLESKRYGEVESKVKAAVQVGLVKDLGTDYFHDPKTRLEAIKNRGNMVPTGWRDMDEKLYGGIERGGLTIFAGQSGAGKSLFLQNISINWAQAGLNVVYITLELSENLCAMRLDAMVASVETRDILKNIDNVSILVKQYQAKHKGNIRLKQLPNGCTINDIRSYVKECEVQTGKKTDAIVIDYLDLMSPVSVKVSPSDQFIKDKYVSEELRNLSTELNVLLVTASQLNRSSYDEVEFGAQNISGGIRKVNTADHVSGLFTSMAMRESGRYQVQFMKTRSSSGVGSKVDLAFCPRTLRISDLEDGAADAITATTSNLMNSLRKKSQVVESAKTEETAVDDTREKTTSLRDMLKRLN